MTQDGSREVTQILASLESGDQTAMSRLLTLVHAELRAQAARFLRRERPGHTLEPTALVHEAYLRLVGEVPPGPITKARFLALSAATMRNILVDHARRRNAAKRGGRWRKVTLPPDLALADRRELDLLALDEALQKLATLDPRQTRIVELRFFGGLSAEEVAEILGVSRGTVQGDWSMARAWLRRELG